MSIRNNRLTALISDCNFYNDIIEHPDYINPWKNKPIMSYNIAKKCRQLEELRSNYHPLTRENRMDKIYDYKVNQPLKTRGISRYEAFSYRIPYVVILCIIIIFILFVV